MLAITEKMDSRFRGNDMRSRGNDREGVDMFAIDFGARSIKVVKLHKISDGYELDNYGISLSPEGAIANGEILNAVAVAGNLAELLRESGIKDRKAIVAITGQKVIIREIVLPIMEDKELMAGVMWEAPKYVPYDLDESIIDAEKVEEFVEKDGNKMMRVLLVAAPKSIIQPYMEVLKKVRIIPKIVDVVSSANIRAFENHLTNKKEEEQEGTIIDVIISIGASSTILSLVEKGNLKFTRNILVGGNDITKAIAISLNISFDKAEKLKRKTKLVLGPVGPEVEKEKIIESEKIMVKILNQVTKEVRKSLSYYKTQSQRVKYNKIVFSGGCANIKNIEKFLSEQFEIPIIIGDPLERIKINKRFFDIGGIKKLKDTLATVIGLAMRER